MEIKADEKQKKLDENEMTWVWYKKEARFFHSVYKKNALSGELHNQNSSLHHFQQLKIETACHALELSRIQNHTRTTILCFIPTRETGKL